MKCVKRQKNGKAAGPDDIPYAFYKNGGEVMIDRMTKLSNYLIICGKKTGCRENGMNLE